MCGKVYIWTWLHTLQLRPNQGAAAGYDEDFG